MTLWVGAILGKRGGHRHCASGNMFLFCHMILQDHLIKGSCDFMIGSLSWQVTTLPSLVAIITLVAKI